ncbi:MAG: aminotransferase class I/II-fold pyridoxal phosphate-dependent enzyme [Anaerolineae bacterium]|jgi:LL-diaminopimelate aminotransferase|nr:aminotransferase class I/II-fold pyridoxal phosphate-dependent enzyme [Anaerolineae bacterium]
MILKAERLATLPPYPFALWSAQVAQVERRGVDVIRLDIGNPDMAPPEPVVAALCASAQESAHHGYGGYRGLATLRRAMADYYARRFGVALDPDAEVLPLIGSKEGIVNLALACLDNGDVVLAPDPGYAPYAMGAMLAGAEVVTFPLLAEHSFLPVLDAIPRVAADKAKLMWLNYPNNPTGGVADLGFLTQAVEFGRDHGILIAYDAPYCDVAYDGYVAPSILAVDGAIDVAIEFNSLSKTYNMAGWRIGMAVGNRDAIAALAQVKSNVDSGLFHPLQEAAICALATGPAWIEARNATYRERLQILVDGLREVGFDASLPKAALYLWASVPEALGGGESATSLARLWLEQAGVAVAPGAFFGPSGAGYVRISATAPTERIREAMARIKALA